MHGNKTLVKRRIFLHPPKRTNTSSRVSPVNELFPVEKSLSPRRGWLEQHGLVLYRLPTGTYRCELDEENYGSGRTKDLAVINFCVKTGIKHWNNPKDGIV